MHLVIRRTGPAADSGYLMVNKQYWCGQAKKNSEKFIENLRSLGDMIRAGQLLDKEAAKRLLHSMQ